MQLLKRNGMTLVELLVVIGIIAMLLALLFPAVQRVRDAAHRAHCSNNLRQMGVALHAYHQAHHSLPPGVTSERPAEPFPRLSWLGCILPYIEQGPLWQQTEDAYRKERDPFVNPPHLGLANVIRIFTCPVDPRTHTVRVTHGERRVGLTSYLGVSGIDLYSRDGVLFLDSQIRIGDISDGTSNTVVVGERPPSPDFWYGWWYAGDGQALTGSGDMVLGVRERSIGWEHAWFCDPGPYHFGPGRIDEQCDLFHFWSLHVGGAHFLFADASVRFLRYSADSVLPALGTRSGNEPVTISDI